MANEKQESTDAMSNSTDYVKQITGELFDVSVRLNLDLEKGSIEHLSRHTFKLRQLISELSIHSGERESINFSKFFSNRAKLDSVNKSVSSFINYRERLEKIDSDQIPKGSVEAKMLKLEINVPLKWDVNVDTVFIKENFAYKNDLIIGLQEVEQRNLFIFDDNIIFDVKTGREFEVEKLKDFLMETRAIVGSEAIFIQDKHEERKIDFEENISMILMDYNSRANTIAKFQDIWNDNQILGYEWRIMGYSHRDLAPYFKDQNVLVISPGPSLKGAIDEIKASANQSFISIATAQACPALAKYDIIPDFVMVVDATDYSFVLENFRDISMTSLIADESVHPNFLNKKFKNLFTIVTSKDNLGLQNAFLTNVCDLDGGTVSLQACSLARRLGANSITVIGQDLAISKGNYFVSGGLRENVTDIGLRTILKTQTFQKEVSGKVPDHFVNGWNGEPLITKPDYAVFHRQFEEFARVASKCTLYNCSVGGAFINGFIHIEIAELIKQIGAIKQREVDLDKHDIRARAKRGQKFIDHNLRVLEKVIKRLESAVRVINRKNSTSEDNLNQIDRYEKELIKISKTNSQLSKFLTLSIIHFNRKLLYVEDLRENLEISQEFYMEICAYLKRYKKNCIKVKNINKSLQKIQFNQ